MSTESPYRNPFMLMVHPELVMAAVEASEHLKQLHRRECHPLDKPQPRSPSKAIEGMQDDDGPSA